jgi:hypothetical protein
MIPRKDYSRTTSRFFKASQVQVVFYKTYNLRKRMIRKHLSGWWENYIHRALPAAGCLS